MVFRKGVRALINSAETQPPVARTNQLINSNETIPPGTANASSTQSVLLLAGESIADSYVINSLLQKQGKQSNVYLAKKWGKSYVVKVYNNGWHPSSQMQSFLTNVRHPNIANVIECGDYDGNYYEIYEYYSEGTLEEVGELSSTHIQNVIIPSINEGLHELHRNGIVHCDIKPSNLFYADNNSRVIIGDCGISGYANSNGKLVDAVRGTPEYAPRVKALLWSAAMSPAYDYGSFGLVLCKAVLGHSLFEGMSIEEISKAWEGGLDLPSKISGRISVLIRGLLNEDEDQRWGYIQVKRWCEGEYIRPINRNIYAQYKREKQFKPLIFGRFDGQTLSVTSLHQLSLAIHNHWSQATKIIKRRELFDFVRQFDETLYEKIRELSACQDVDAAVFKLLLYIDDDPEAIFYCGKKYVSIEEYVTQLSTGNDDIAIRFLYSGLLVYYLRFKEYDKAQVDKLEQLIKRNGTKDMASISTICFALQGKKDLEIFDVTVDSLDSLIPILKKCSIEEIDDLLGSSKFIAWLNRLGYEKEMRKMKEAFS